MFIHFITKIKFNIDKTIVVILHKITNIIGLIGVYQDE